MQKIFLRWRVHAAALGILALAFFARVYRLADKNIWWDEGWTVWLAQHDWAWIALRTASDEHPPLHYWLMHVWQGVFGPEMVTGRFFSLVFGVLGVALLYRIGKAMGDARVGLLAALFLALARFQIWWSQDIKNYTLSAFFAWASVYFVWQIVERSNVPTFKRSSLFLYVGYVLCAALALYSHYLAALIVLANNVFVGIVLLMWRRAGGGRAQVRDGQAQGAAPTFLKWCAAQIAVFILLAPWLYMYLQNSATWTALPSLDFGLFLQLAATVLSLGITTYIENYTLIVLGMLGIAALSIGWIVARRQASGVRRPSIVVRRSSFAVLYMLLIVLLPPVLIYLLALTPAAIFAPKVQARYLMMLTPALMLLLAFGVLFAARYSKFVAAGLAVFIVSAQLFSLTNYFQERILRDEYASVAQMVNNFGAADDAIVLNTDQEYPTFLYYLKRPFAWVGVPNGAQVNEATAQRIADDVLPHRGVWVVTIPDALQKDPQRLVEQKIAERLSKQYEQTFGDKRLALYADTLRNVKDAAPENFSPLVARSEVLDERLKLVGMDLPVREAFPGDVVRVVTYWAAQDVTTLNVSLQKPNGEIVARAAYPLSIGAHERAQTDLQIPPDVNTNALRVVAHARLGALSLGTIQILPRENIQPATAAAMQPRAERFGDSIRLIGVNLPAQKFRAGDVVPVTLFWQTDAPIPTSYTVFVHLLGDQYNPAQNNFLWGQADDLPVNGKLPTNAWPPKQTIADAYQVKFDDHAPPGLYKIEIGMYDANGMRLRVFDANGYDLGDALIVGTLQIEQ